MKAYVWWSTALVVVPVLAGCLGGPSTNFQKVELVEGAYKLPLDIHIVTAGFEDFDAAAVERHLKQPLPPFLWIRADTVGGLIEPEPLQYELTYMFHEAPDDFAKELFAYAGTQSVLVDPDAALEAYDRAGPQRICEPASTPMLPPAVVPVQDSCRPVQRIDASSLETWIADHRSEYGVEFGGAGYTVFLLDAYTKGYLPTDTYHQYGIDDGTLDPGVKVQRAWGGGHDFVFLDVSAPSTGQDLHPWGNYSRSGADPVAQIEDRPIWDYSGSTGREMGVFYENQARNIFDAARILWARHPIYPFEYAEKYVLPMYVIIDPNAQANPDSPLARFRAVDVEAHTEAETIRRAFQELAPWAEVELQLKFIYLPDDDPALAAAVVDAKSRYNNQVDYGILKKYFRENWDTYVPTIEGARVYPTFAMWLEYPSTGIFAYSDGDEYGRSWGVFFNAADAYLCPRAGYPVCAIEDRFYNDDTSWWRLWNAILVHELGHSFGLTHTHDAPGIDEDGYTTYTLNWLWDSTASVMTYRHAIPTFDQFDKDLLLRAHTVTLGLAVREAGSDVPQEASKMAEEALATLSSGDWQAAFDLAREAFKASGLALKEESFGTPGEPRTTTVQVPVSSAPLSGSIPLFLPVTYEGVDYAELPLEVPDGAVAMLIEYREAAAPTHRGWGAYAAIENDEGAVTGLWNNGYDKVVLKNLDRCTGGCFIRLYGYSGSNLAYDVTVTPYFASAA